MPSASTIWPGGPVGRCGPSGHSAVSPQPENLVGRIANFAPIAYGAREPPILTPGHRNASGSTSLWGLVCVVRLLNPLDGDAALPGGSLDGLRQGFSQLADDVVQFLLRILDRQLGAFLDWMTEPSQI